MINKSNGPNKETVWHYLGPDNRMYGPYASKDMLFWLETGYFNDSLRLRTENESSFHTLGEWSAVLGNHPFSMNVHSMESVMAQVNQVRPPPGAMMMMPPGIPPPFPPPMRFQHLMPMPPMMSHQMGQSNQHQYAHQLHSQPPSEPIDAGSLSHTPDSENENQINQQQKSQYVLADVPQLYDAETETDNVETKDVGCQTNPIKISQADASRLLSELIGQIAIIN